MKIDVPTVNLLKVRSETEKLLRVLLKTEGNVSILSEQDPVFRFLAENSRGRKGYLMRMRDILDEAVLVETEGSYVFLLGLEAQSEPDPSMAARIHLYDALAIMHQYEKEVHDKLGDVVFMSKDRFEKAFPLGMSLKPMKSFIIYTGLEEWFGPRSVLEMMADKAAVARLGKTEAYSEEVDVVSIARLSKETAYEIGGEWGLLSRLLSDSLEGIPKSSDYKGEVLGKLGQQIYNNTCGRTFPEEKNMPVVNVLERIEKANQSIGEARGEARGEVKGRYESVRNLMDTMGLNADDAMNALKIPSAERDACLKQLNRG